ncbi:UPF0182 family protein [Nocardioides sp. 1609]|uniref:UPF0182 family membrane protein n=1 Tax=Nocardioides sp. 1609 TaxID=2508327 RepID=UPI00106F3585|nr:UPF0182 family protein [Nocardioides sp. 1609]
MSDLFDDDPRAAPARSRAGRSRALLITAVVLVVALFGLTGFASIYTDRIWYNNAGYGQVFSTMLWTRVLLFLAFGVVLGGAVALNVFLAYRFRPLFRPTSREQSNLDRYRDVVTPIRTWLVVGIAVVVGAFAGASGMSHWRTFLLWRNGSSVGTDDPYFKKDVGFYLFDLPWWHFVVDFTMATMVLAIIAALVTHYLYGGIRLQATQDKLSGAAQAQLSVLLGLFVLAKGVDYYLDRFDLVTQKNSLFTGMNYTGENAVLPAKNILMAVAVICAILFFLNVWRRTWQLPSIGLALLALSAVLIGMIFPAAVQQFQVKPSEADKEEPYIQKNIEATRMAYDLEGTVTEPYTPATSLEDPSAFQDLLSSVPLVDPALVSSAFENIQQERAYYSVPDVLDVDRYEIEGNDRAVVLGVRELDQSKLSEDARNWSNLHTVYTHGNGIIAAYANQRDAQNTVQDDTSGDQESASSGRLEWAQGINAGEDDLSSALGAFESRVYYGELSPDYSVVGQPEESDTEVELNLPTPGSELGELTTYDGQGDASVGSAFNQLMFAIKFGEPNFLLSGRVHDNSQVLYVRQPAERVEKVAPWLTVDGDPYPAIVEGRIQWIVDGYTTTDRFPNSQRASFETMTADAQQLDNGLQTVPTDEVNYMRNAVKATVDAYDGTVKLYAWDEEDPMLKAWRGAFPDTVLDRDQMSDELLEHVRYPVDLFKVQRYQYARYHVENASDWYQNNDRWSVPNDPQTTNTFQAPYRLFVPGQEDDATTASAYSLSTVYVPYGRNNLASFVSVDSDATQDSYGTIRVREIVGADEATEGDEQARGPGQVANDFQSDNQVRDALLPFTQGESQVDYGNLLTLPVGRGLLYVQPVYVSRQAAGASYPELRRVLVKYGSDVGIGATFQEALADAFGGTTTIPPETDPDPTPPSGGTGTLQEQLDQKLEEAQAAFTAAEAALADQDLATYQARIGDAEAALAAVIRLRDQIKDEEGGAADTPSEGATDTPTEDPSAAGGS